MILNQGLQNKSVETLKAFEEKDLKRHASPGELRTRAGQFLGDEIAKMAGFLELFN